MPALQRAGRGLGPRRLTTRAERDGDEWVVNGQKVWNTGAAHADLGLLLARTDWDVPKHRGITYFAIPMHQPGVEVRPLRQMNGHASFNEVFLDDARVPAADVIGAGRRRLDGRAHHAGARAPARSGASRTPPRPTAGARLAEAIAEQAVAASSRYKWYPQRAGRPDLVVERGRRHRQARRSASCARRS